LFAQVIEPPNVRDTARFRFLVAGHAYGSHRGDNLGLHPPLVAKLHAGAFGKLDFIVFTGDVLRRFEQESWASLTKELRPLGCKYYITPGNHDVTDFGSVRLREAYGSLHYRFDVGTTRFVFLNTQEVSRTIPPGQLLFLRAALKESEGIGAFLVFFHELIWLAKKPHYKTIRANSRSRQNKLGKSNYWRDIHPLLVQQAPRPVFVIAGDVAGNADAIPAFKDQVDNVSLIASGMGEVKGENALVVTVDGSNVAVNLHCLDGSDPRLLDYYTPANLNSLPRDAFRRTPPPGSSRDWLIALIAVGIVGIGALIAMVRRRRPVER
jgi:hypothetical protein